MFETVDYSLSLDSLYKSATAIKDASLDYFLDSVTGMRLQYRAYDNSIKIQLSPEVSIRYTLSAYALSQLCAKLEVPASYIEKCISGNNFELAEYNVNDWLTQYGKSLLLRTTEKRVRGIVSNKYSIFDSHEILNIMEGELDSLNVKGAYLSEERFHCRLIAPEKLDVPNEVLYPGFQIDSSDVGRSILICRFFVYRQVCTNGLIVPMSIGAQFKQKHIGISPDNFRDSLIQSISAFPAMIEMVTTLIKSGINKKDRIEIDTEDNVERFKRELKDKFLLPEDGCNKVISLMKEKCGNTLWGAVNALTEVAQDYTLDRRIEIEKGAGELLVA